MTTSKVLQTLVQTVFIDLMQSLTKFCGFRINYPGLDLSSESAVMVPVTVSSSLDI